LQTFGLLASDSKSRLFRIELQTKFLCAVTTGNERFCKLQELMDFAYAIRGGKNELAKLAVSLVAWGNSDFFELFCTAGYPVAMAADVMRVLKTYHDRLPKQQKIKIPAQHDFHIVEVKESEETEGELQY
jgi:hypothetical protein